MEQKQQPTTTPTAQQQLFIGTAITLSWQLLVVVLMPALSGHFIDKHYQTTPLFTLVGLAAALSLAALVTYRGYKTLYNDHQARNRP